MAFWPEDGFEIWKSLEESDQVERTMRKEEWPPWNFRRNFAFLPTLPSGADFFLIEHNSQIIKFTIKFTVQWFFFPIYSQNCVTIMLHVLSRLVFSDSLLPHDCSQPDSSVHIEFPRQEQWNVLPFPTPSPLFKSKKIYHPKRNFINFKSSRTEKNKLKILLEYSWYTVLGYIELKKILMSNLGQEKRIRMPTEAPPWVTLRKL